MSQTDERPAGQHPPHGQLGYLQLPAVDIARSLAFYEKVFRWSGELEYGSFEGPGLIGQWTVDRPAASAGGPLLWLMADAMEPTLQSVVDTGGMVHGQPELDQGERWLIEIDDPAGNRLGIVVFAG